MNSDCFRVSMGHIDPLNVGFGFFLQIEKNGKTILNISRHPVTGQNLSFATAIEVLAMYAPEEVTVFLEPRYAVPAKSYEDAMRQMDTPDELI